MQSTAFAQSKVLAFSWGHGGIESVLETTPARKIFPDGAEPWSRCVKHVSDPLGSAELLLAVLGGICIRERHQRLVPVDRSPNIIKLVPGMYEMAALV